MKFSNILIILLVLIILWLALCHKNNPIQPDTKPATIYKTDKAAIEKARQETADSIRRTEVTPNMEAANYWEGIAKEKIKVIYKDGDTLIEIIDKECPDQSHIVSEYIRKSEEAAVACVNALDYRGEQIAGLENIIKADSLARDTTDKLFNQVVSDLGRLQDYIKKVQPRNQIYAGGTIMGNKANLIGGYGVNLGLKTKKGVMVEVGTLYFNQVAQYTLGLKKVISFRK